MNTTDEQLLDNFMAAKRATYKFWLKEIGGTLFFLALVGVVAWVTWTSLLGIKRPSEKLTEGHWGMVRACEASGNLAMFTPDSYVACVKRESVVWVYVPDAK